MNTERLHAICIDLKESIDSVSLVATLKGISGNLQNIINSPQDSTHQQELTKNIKFIFDKLYDFPTNYYSPAWRQILEELGGSQLLGKELQVRISTIFDKNTITPASALQEILVLIQEVQKFKGAIDGIVSSFEQLQIGYEALEPGECEVGILIPRKAVHNNIQEFGKELQELNFIFGTFSELASGDRETFKIKSISSSELMVFLAAIPPVAACVAHAADKIINLYKTLLEIKKLKGELEKHGVSDANMLGINDHANELMSEGVDKLTLEIVEEYYQGNDIKRKNELTNAVRIALNRLANRIDQGFNIEVRAEPPTELEEGEEETPGSKNKRELVNRVLSVSETLQFIKVTGPRILHLPEKTTESKTTKKE